MMNDELNGKLRNGEIEKCKNEMSNGK